MKNLLNLNGAQQLSKSEQKEVNGGWAACHLPCPNGCYCYKDGFCYRQPNERCFI
jgi:hypothetical protein